jgi:kynureninase
MNPFEAALQRAQALDQADTLAYKRAAFALPEGVTYLDGNSLGALPHGVAERMQRAITQEWGTGLIRSWIDANWYPAPQRVGAQIARLVGAKPLEVITCDSTTVNLFKVLCAAATAQPSRKVFICEEGNFPTDAYITQSTSVLYGKRILLANQDNIESVIAQAGSDLCAVAMTHVHYKTGRMLDMARITALVQTSGGRMIWDLAHSAGVIPVQLNACHVDYAVGCGYKYLNGGPGAPAYVYVREDLIPDLEQPLQGWHGHAAPFAFDQDYYPHHAIDRLLVGTASQLSLIALETSLGVYADISMLDVRRKSESLTHFFIELYDAYIAPLGFGMVTPREAAQRGGQVSFTHQDGYAIMQALIERGVIGDFRAPNILRFGFAPLYVTHADCVHAVRTLCDVMQADAWKEPRHQAKKAVT